MSRYTMVRWTVIFTLAMIVSLSMYNSSIFIGKHWKLSNEIDLYRFDKNDTKVNTKLNLIERYKVNWNYATSEDPWTIAESWINGRHIQPEKTPELGAVLRALSTKKIIHADTFPDGSQIKLMLELEGGQKAIFKPRTSDLKEIFIEINKGMDRPNAEIAAYHLGRIMELRRVPIVAGRNIDFEKEIIPVATANLQNNIYLDDNGTVCIRKRCQPCFYNEFENLCANNKRFQGSMCLWLTPEVKHSIYYWDPIVENRDRSVMNDSFCKTDLMNDVNYKEGHLLLDVIETAIFDFLIGNADRHVVNKLYKNNDTIVVMLDNGKSFGNPFHNENLAFLLGPLFQCCQIRKSTWTQMIRLKGILGEVLGAVINEDPIAPILSEENLLGIDRRLDTAINAVQGCISLDGEESVILTDM